MLTRGEWVSLLEGWRRGDAERSVIAPLLKSSVGGSGAFLGHADDQRRCWIKPQNNGQGTRVPITEQIVGRVGALIGAATGEVVLLPYPA
jgi:hypothetical protein